MPLITTLNEFIALHKRSIFSFLTVGAITAIFYVSLFSFLNNFLQLHYQMAVSIAYIAAISFYFFANRQFTFKSQQSKQSAISRQLIRYMAMILFNYLITIIIMFCTVEMIVTPPYVGIMIAISVTFISNYMIAKFWVFNE